MFLTVAGADTAQREGGYPWPRDRAVSRLAGTQFASGDWPLQWFSAASCLAGSLPENGVTVLSPVPDMRKYWNPVTEPYVYVQNNPVNLADPSGLGPCDPAKTRKDLPPGTLGAVMCKEGKLEAIINEPIDPRTGRIRDWCVLDCALTHEKVHVDQVNKWCPNFCQEECGRPDGSLPQFPATVTRNEAECPAYKAERDCLLAHLRGGGAGMGCDRAKILHRIGEIDSIVRDPRRQINCNPWPLPPIEQTGGA